MTRISARLELRNKNDKIVFGRSMYGENAEIGDLVLRFFDIVPEYVNQAECNLKILDVYHY